MIAKTGARSGRRGPAATALAALAACLLALGVLAAACTSPAEDQPSAPTGPPSITGTVTSTAGVTNGDIVGSFLVEDGNGDYDKASVTVTVRTGWFRPDRDGGYVAIARPTGQELASKTVAVKFTGPVAESYPVQATADWVIVED
jgi:hypothetical protein